VLFPRGLCLHKPLVIMFSILENDVARSNSITL
jgi:hypothetical protein